MEFFYIATLQWKPFPETAAFSVYDEDIETFGRPLDEQDIYLAVMEDARKRLGVPDQWDAAVLFYQVKPMNRTEG